MYPWLESVSVQYGSHDWSQLLTVLFEGSHRVGREEVIANSTLSLEVENQLTRPLLTVNFILILRWRTLGKGPAWILALP